MLSDGLSPVRIYDLLEEGIFMEKYEKPRLEVDYFLTDVITESGPPVACGAEDDELPIIPVNDKGDF